MGFKKAAAAYSAAHLVVDFSCAFFIFYFLRADERWLLYMLAYNFFAFAMQMPLGIAADFTGRNRIYAALGCVLVAASAALAHAPLALCILAGLGNGLFHIGAGRDVLVHSGGRYSMLGIFVSPGAVGLYLGSLAGKDGLVPAFVPLCLLLLSAVIILLMTRNAPEAADNGVKSVIKPSFAALLLLCVFLVVCLRSYVGMTLSFPWSAQGRYALWLLLALALGKAAGGILADRLGAAETALMSLLASALLFVLYREPVCGIAAVFLFNMSMPVALGAAAQLLPQRKGFGFGLLTFGLFIGFLPVLLGWENSITLPWGYCAAALISAALLFTGLRGWAHIPTLPEA